MQETTDIFIGRRESISQLKNLINSNLNKSFKRIKILSIFGKSGVGKSSLVDHVMNELNLEVNQQVVLKIAHIRNLNSLESIFTNQLISNSNVQDKKFKRIIKLRKIIEAIDRDYLLKNIKDHNKITEIRSKLFADASFVGIKSLLKYASKKAGISKLEGMISDEELHKLVEHASDKSYNRLDRIFNTKKFRVDSDIAKELADDLICDIEKIIVDEKSYKKALLFIIDDYEGLHTYVEELFLRHMIGPLRNKDFNSLFIFIGRDEVEWVNQWRIHQQHKEASIELKVFDDDEAINYLSKCGIDNIEDQKEIIKRSHKLPLLLEILVNAKLKGTEAKWIEDYFNRITHHMTKQQKEWLEKLAFLDTRIDEDTVCYMLDNDHDEAKEAFDWFKKEGTAYVNTSDGWEVDQVVKALIQERVSQDSYFKLHQYKEQAQRAKEKFETLRKQALSINE